ncbi:PD-(D/E)XK nuclease family protein [Halopenitus sp. POP-27]|uniref:PD-(D/E)XK nuclease family protein n=1 Tax=Halopenitus sp. POP-27 TaxID=2994425 RepID=UPI002468B967|nr:PD-(D/E)XK nuclease family protein [Halopenitus sp. POP-27]
MAVTRSRSIDALYDAVADYDLVLTTDSPLSLALNRRLDRPRLGRFAATPRMLASGELNPQDDRSLFVRLVEETDLRYKHAAHLLENVLGCWEETGDIRAILDYERFDTAETRRVIAVIESAESAHRDLAEYRIEAGTSVAVIGEDRFTALDRSVLPADYDAIDPFVDDEFDLPPFHVFDDSTAIVDAVVDNVTPETAGDVAVVMDGGSEYPALVESAFEAAGIPFHGGPGFSDDEALRTYLRLLRTAQGDSRARVSDVRPILSHLGRAPSAVDDETFLHELDHEALRPLQAFCRTVDDHTFGQALTTFEEWGGRSLDAFREELRALGLHDERVTTDSVADLEFYLQTFDVPVDRDDAGVLLADATAAAYVDRPVVFHLGMDVDWTHRVLDRPWIDADETDEQYLREFQILLQNGQDRYYLVQETSAGQPVTPCLYFHDLLDGDLETFGDLPHVAHARRRTSDGETGFETAAVDVAPAEIETVSQSSLNTFLNCPRDYFFDAIVDTPDRDYFRKGTLFHDYAEFSVNHPDVVEDADRSELVDLMLAEMRPYVPDIELEPLATELEIGLDTIERFIADDPPTDREYSLYEQQEGDNVFADHFGTSIDSPITERWFEDPQLGGKGKVDLIHAPETLLDYKSGGRTSASTVVSRSDIQEISDDPDFQALLYLAHHRREFPDERLEFVFFHFLELVDDVVAGGSTGDSADAPARKPDLEDALVRITYHPTSFGTYAGSREAFDALCAGVAESNDRRKTLERLGYDAYASFFERHDVPATDDPDALLATAFATRFTEHAKSEVGDYVYVENGTKSALKTLLRIRGRNYFADELDAFEDFLDDQIDRINRYRASQFPVGEPNVDRVTHRDLIRTDD